MENKPKGYISAAGFDWLLPIYDPLLRWVFREDTFKQRLITAAAIRPQHHVLDLGCGTGTLTLMIKNRHPDAKVHGLDGDSKALGIARRKAEAADVEIFLDKGLSYDLPYPNDAFDRVLSSLVFHHLTHQRKVETLHEVRRILKPGGALFTVDFGKPATAIGAALVKLVHHAEHIRDHIEGDLVRIMHRAGLVGAEQFGRQRVLLAGLSFYRASKELLQSKPAASR
jgi:ubiquinone/menaquinone biosynthesis C-methylase UbiE